MANQQNTPKENKDATTPMTGTSGTGSTNKTGTVNKLGSAPAGQSGIQANTAKDSMSSAGKDATSGFGTDSMSGTGTGAKNTSAKPDEPKTSESANQLASQVSEVLRGNTGAAKDIISQAKESTSNLAGQALGQVQEKATTQIDKQKANLAQGLGNVADSIRQIGENLKGSDQSGVVALTAQYGDSLAQQVEQFSDYLEKHNIGELMRDVERFARRNPGLFIGGAFALGFLGARFLKSSNTHQELMAVERHNQSELSRIKNTAHQATASQGLSTENKDKTSGGGTLNTNLTGSNRPL